MSAASRPRRTLAEVTRLLEQGEAVELIDGEIVHRTMARPEYRHHADGRVTVMTGGVGDVIRAELFGKETR